MNIEIDTVRGFQDFLPPKSLKRKKIKQIVENTFSLYGFQPIETPIIEYDELMRSDFLASEQEDETTSSRFKLKDKGSRNLGLRYEFTFQLARILKQNPNIKLPLRRYQIGEVFRDEPVSLDKFRQFTQCDIDIIGDPSVNADIECLTIVSDILDQLKIKSEIQVNNRVLLKSIIESVQISNTRQIMKELDKIDKIGEDAVKVNLKKYADSNQVVTLFKILEKPLSFFRENSFDGSAELENLIDGCKDHGVKLKFNPLIIRGLGYYTGNVFEVRNPLNSTIAAGGRYDKSVGSYLNQNIPAVGISFGLERTCELASVKIEPNPKTIIVSLSQNKGSIKLAKMLRKNGVSCILFYNEPEIALEYASDYQIPFAIFVGEQELDSGKYKIKDLISKQEKSLSEKQLLKMLN